MLHGWKSYNFVLKGLIKETSMAEKYTYQSRGSSSSLISLDLLGQQYDENGKDSESTDLIEQGHGWDKNGSSRFFKVSSDSITIKRLPTTSAQTDMARGKNGYRGGVHVWDISWPQKTRGSHAMVGVVTEQAQVHARSYLALLGSDDQSIGWNITKKTVVFNNCTLREYPDGMATTVPDDFRMIVNLEQGTLSFASAQGASYGVCFGGLRLFTDKKTAIYPAISATKDDTMVMLRYRIDTEDQPSGGEQLIEIKDGVVKSLDKIRDSLEQLIRVLDKCEPKLVIAVVGMIKENVQQVFESLKTVSRRQMLGDMFADLHGAKSSVKYLRFLKGSDNVLKSDQYITTYCSVMDAIRCLCDFSIKLCKELDKAGFYQLLNEDLKYLEKNYRNKPLLKGMVLICLGVVHNCARYPETRKELRSADVTKAAFPILADSRVDPEIRLRALYAVVHLFLDDDIKLLNVVPEIINYVVKDLSQLLSSADWSRGDQATLHVRSSSKTVDGAIANEEIRKVVNCVNDAARSVECRSRLVKAGIVATLETVLEEGRDGEKEAALEALWSLTAKETVKEIEGKSKLRETLRREANSRNEQISTGAKRLQTKIRELLTTTKPMPNQMNHFFNGSIGIIGGEQRFEPGPVMGSICEYRALCFRFADEILQIDDWFRDKSFDTCYCPTCSGGTELYYTRGVPPKDYGLPVGWTRMGLKPPPRTNALKAFDSWHRAYHGTRPENIKRILLSGDLLYPGDVGFDGPINPPEGHFTEYYKPKGFDICQVFVTPSIHYAGVPAYSKPSKFIDGDTGEKYNAKVALQLLIHPEKYIVGQDTIGAKEQIDTRFSNAELEWSTKVRGSVIIYSILIKLEKSKDKEEPGLASERRPIAMSKVAVSKAKQLPRKYNCDYEAMCRQYLATLDIPERFLDSDFNKCYCSTCHNNRNDTPHSKAGKPERMYGLPIDWCRFAIRVPEDISEEAFQNYHRGYHATTECCIVSSILARKPILPKSSDKSGTAEENSIMMSPSINYMEYNAITPQFSFQCDVDGCLIEYNTKIVLQVLAPPDSYTARSGKIGGWRRIDPKIGNDELDWKIHAPMESKLVMYGVLVKLFDS